MRRAVAVAACGVVVALGGCGGSGSDDPGESADQPSAQALTAAFSAAADQAYADNDLDRQADFGAGTTVEGCFILDDEGAEAIAEAAGSDAPDVTVSDQNYLSGPPGEDESTSCSINDASVDGPGSGLGIVGAGTTTLTPDQYLQRQLRLGDSKPLDGTAAGLDPDEVVAADHEGVNVFAWVHDDFVIGISGPPQVLSVEQGFAALPVAVDEVSRVLTD